MHDCDLFSFKFAQNAHCKLILLGEKYIWEGGSGSGIWPRLQKFRKMTSLTCENIVCPSKETFEDLKVTGGHFFFFFFLRFILGGRSAWLVGFLFRDPRQ